MKLLTRIINYFSEEETRLDWEEVEETNLD